MSAPEPLVARSPLAAQSISAQGWSGGGVLLTPRFDVCAAMLTLRKAHAQIPGLELPAANRVSVAESVSLLSCGQRRYLAVAQGDSREQSLESLRRRLHAAAAVVDYSDQLAFISIAGADGARVLARLCSIDVDPRVFAPSSAAVLRMEGVRAFLWREERADRFMLAVQRSLAAGAWESLVEACESLAAG